jgi:hypothetical protein
MPEQAGQSEEHKKADEAQEKHEKAQAKMKELEQKDELPTDLEDWPSDESKYVTYGGAEGDHSYDEGPEKKLGPTLERLPGGGVKIEGEEVDDPDQYKAEPIPGGPTDPDSPETSGERKKREKMERMYGEDDPSVKAAKEAAEKRRSPGDED